MYSFYMIFLEIIIFLNMSKTHMPIPIKAPL